jgi:hypothetical protein
MDLKGVEEEEVIIINIVKIVQKRSPKCLRNKEEFLVWK